MLEKPLSDYHKLLSVQKIALKKLGIESVRDILFHFPVRYGDVSEFNQIGSLEDGKQVVIFGRIKNLKTDKTFRTKIARSTATIEDDSGTIKATWFNQPYIAKMYSAGQMVKVTGKVSYLNEKPILNNPSIEKLDSIPLGVGESLFSEDAEKSDQYLIPVYKLSKGISSTWFYHTIKRILSSDDFKKIEDYIPEDILKKYKLPDLKTALIWIHAPKKSKNAEAARKRFAFEEVFLIQMQRQMQKRENDKKDSYKVNVKKETLTDFTQRLPFTLTDSQTKAIKQIFTDFKTEHAMSRLLEGDVGSGKTAVAAATSYAVINTRPEGQDFGTLQVAYMAPTEVLAKQLFESFIGFFKENNIKIGLITSSGCYKFPSKVNGESYTNISRAQLLKWVENGEIPILIGTHSLIQKTVNFKHLAYVIIDEQHRFGTNQRAKLAKKVGFLPHLLSMTATPIPRTLALTIYGDLDLTIIDEMPSGRKKVITEIVEKDQKSREKVYEKITEELESGRQIYVICPRINEPDPDKVNAMSTRSVMEEAEQLRKKIFPKYKVGEMHSKLKKEEKAKVMKDFEEGKIDILVSTSVVEVGVNVPNATNIVIEGAERFGLAQLHQLRGRVQRSNHQSYCYLFTESKSDTTIKRLQALKTSKNGFELAEHDLKNRGAGELGGGKQWGISDIGMEAIRNVKMVEAARNEAKEIVEKIDEIKKKKTHSSLLSVIEKKKEVHFE